MRHGADTSSSIRDADRAAIAIAAAGSAEAGLTMAERERVAQTEAVELGEAAAFAGGDEVVDGRRTVRSLRRLDDEVLQHAVRSNPGGEATRSNGCQ